jgi:acetyltransferase-like isoleucine patch superfamily enzyme
VAEAAVTTVPAEAIADCAYVPPAVAPASTKRLMDALAHLIVLPWLVGYRLSVKIMPSRRELFFQGYSQALSMRPGITGIYLRRAFYRRTLTKCPLDCAIGFGTTFAVPEVEIGNGVTIANYCNIGQVSIGDDTLIGSNVHILSGKHQHNFERLDVPLRHQGGHRRCVRIGRDVWIGNHATVLEDIGDQAVVAAGTLVSKPVPPRALVAGNPGRFVGERGAARPGARKDNRDRSAT